MLCLSRGLPFGRGEGGAYDPRARAPRVAKVHDKEPHHGDSSPTGSRLGGPLILILRNDDGDDDVTRCHCSGGFTGLTSVSFHAEIKDAARCNEHTSNGTNGEHRLAPDTVHIENGRDSGDTASKNCEQTGGDTTSSFVLLDDLHFTRTTDQDLGGQTHNMAMPTTPVASRLVSLLSRPSLLKMVGA